MSRPSLSSRFYHPQNSRWEVQIINSIHKTVKRRTTKEEERKCTVLLVSFRKCKKVWISLLKYLSKLTASMTVPTTWYSTYFKMEILYLTTKYCKSESNVNLWTS
jgi:hypothetical protein